MVDKFNERHAQWGIDAVNAVVLLDRVIDPPTTPRRAMAEVLAPRRAITA